MTCDDKQYLLLLKNNTSDIEILCCVNILLEDYEEANRIYLDMEKDIKEQFSKFPIYHLMNK